MEIPVTLVPSIDAQAWPNEIYVGYATGWMRRYDQEFDPDNPAPQKLQPYLADAKTQVQKLLADYKEATAAPQTELIDQADRQRPRPNSSTRPTASATPSSPRSAP